MSPIFLYSDILVFFNKSAEALHSSAQRINYGEKTAFSFSEIAYVIPVAQGGRNQRL